MLSAHSCVPSPALQSSCPPSLHRTREQGTVWAYPRIGAVLGGQQPCAPLSSFLASLQIPSHPLQCDELWNSFPLLHIPSAGPRTVCSIEADNNAHTTINAVLRSGLGNPKSYIVVRSLHSVPGASKVVWNDIGRSKISSLTSASCLVSCRIHLDIRLWASKVVIKESKQPTVRGCRHTVPRPTCGLLAGSRASKLSVNRCCGFGQRNDEWADSSGWVSLPHSPVMTLLYVFDHGHNVYHISS